MRKALALLVMCGWFVGTASAQEPPKPGPEHNKFRENVGTWDATMEMMGQKSTGTMTWKLDLGGMWLVSDFKGSFGGMDFKGHGITGYDTSAKKYQSVWVDNMTTSLMVMDGSYDATGKIFTEVGEMKDPTGKSMKAKMVTEMKGPDHIFATMYSVEGGKDSPMFTIEYKRKK